MSDTSKENVQITPSQVRIVPNFKLAKVMCNLPTEQYNRAVNGVERGIIEKRNHKKHGEIITSYRITNADGYDGIDPLNEFDRAVLSVCSSEFEYGNSDTTPAIIFRNLTGRVGKGSNAKPHLNQRDDILTSVMKLMNTLIWIDDSDTNEKLGYEPTSASETCSAILPAYFVKKTVNGQDATVIYFDRESPIMEIAKSRNQIIRYDTALLDVPNVQNTYMNITIKNYLACRVKEIMLHHMTPTITFDDLFAKVRITDASRKTQMDAREVAKAFFEHLKSISVLKSLDISKKGNKFYGVTFSY